LSTSKTRVGARLASLAVVTLLLVHGLALTGVVDLANTRVFDTAMQLRNRAAPSTFPTDQLVVQIDLDDPSLVTMGGRVPGREEMATVMRMLASAGTTAQVFDIVFAGQSGEGDAALVDAAAAARNVYLGAAMQGRAQPSRPPLSWPLRVEGDPAAIPAATSVIEPFAALRDVAAGVGALNVTPDADGVLRRMPLVMRVGDQYYPSLTLAVASDLLGVPPARIRLAPGRSLVLEGARLPGAGPRDLEIPIDASGALLLDFRDAWESGRHVPFARIWRDERDPTALPMWETILKGRIAIVADLTTGRADIGGVPIDATYPLAGLHATALRNILAESFLRPVPIGITWGLKLGALALLVMVSVSRPRWLWPVAAVIALLLAAGAFALFARAGIVIDVVQTLIAIGLFTAVAGAWRYLDESRARELTRRAFESYFPPAVVSRLLADETAVAGSRNREITVLFSDIAGFTARSTTMSPEAVQSFLNTYFSRMVAIVFRHGGTVDKFIGDGLMVFFNDPEDQPDHAERCVRCAIEMQAAVRALSVELVAAGEPAIQIRVGINTGSAIVGDLGSADRLSYTAVGDTVNLSQRLESAAPVGGILISAATAAQLPPALAVDPVPDVQVKGFDKTIRVFVVRQPVEARMSA
jgi:adenylate cyclase